MLTILLLSIFVLTPWNYVQACDFSGTPWFNVEVQIDSKDLPSGVSMINGVIKNNTDKPFYLVVRRSSRIFMEEKWTNTEIPTALNGRYYEPKYKIEKNSVSYYSANLYGNNYANGLPVPTGWKDYETEDGYKLDQNGVGSLEIYPKNNKTEDDRPLLVQNPKPENFKINAYYDGKFIEIDGTFKYTLNYDYDPKSIQKGSEACSRFNNAANPIPVTGLINANDFKITTLITLGLLFFVGAGASIVAVLVISKKK
jgi:hypothetical protein